MKTSRALITLTCLAALLAPARAGDPQKPRDAGEAQDLPGRWEPLDGASRGGLWPGFEARFGPGWALYADPVTGSPSMLAGPGIDAGGPIEADDAGIARARALLEQLADVLGVDDPSAFTLERAVAYPNAHGQKMVTINFKQQHRGLDVRHQATGGTRDHLAMVKLHFNGTLGRLVLLGSDAVPGLRLSDDVRLGEEQALGAALATAAGPVSATDVRSYVSVRGSRRFLAREAQVAIDVPAQLRTAVFDAHTGELVETRDDLKHVDVTGTVTAGTREQPAAALVQTALSALRVGVVGGGNATTDQNGGFTIANAGNVPVNVAGRMTGLWADVRDQSGNGDLSFNQPANPGVPAAIVLNPAPGQAFETAETNGYLHTTMVHDFVQARVPAFTGMAAFPVNVNVNDVCNAFFIPLPQPSINFFRAGGNCPNTAYLDIVAHEYGHAFHHWFHGWANPGAFSEGIGDHLSLYITGQRQFARNGFNNGTPWRDYRAGGGANQTLYPCINCEVHKGGEVWAGFTMDLRDNLIATRGAGVGIPLAETLTIGQYAGNPMNEVAAVAFIYLNDDNDGSLLNGTPNCADITRAALRHNLPILPPVAIPCGAPAPAPGLAWRYRVPVFEAGLNAPGANDIQPTLENTGKLIWWSSNRAGGFGGHDVYGAQRATLANAWSPAVNIAGVNTPSDELYPCISSDLLSLWFVSNRPGGQGGQDIWVSTRANLQAPFPAAVPVAALNSPGLEEDPAISSDGLEIFFGSDRAGDRGLWTATRPNVAAPWGAPVRIAELDTPGQEHSPAISSDGIRLYFASDRAGGVGSADHYLAVRVNRGARWTIYRNLVEMNSPFWDCNADETADAFSIYFTSYTGGGATSDLYRADQVLPQLRANEVVRPGQMLTVALRRDPGNFGVLVLGWGQVPPTPIPGLFGNLEIVIGTNLAWGPLSADGLLGFSFVVPQIPYFVAQVQGFCVDGANAIYASNLASITFTP